jgi:hypothetical protein
MLCGTVRRLRADGGPNYPVLFSFPTRARERHFHRHLTETAEADRTVAKALVGLTIATCARDHVNGHHGVAGTIWRLVGNGGHRLTLAHVPAHHGDLTPSTPARPIPTKIRSTGHRGPTPRGKAQSLPSLLVDMIEEYARRTDMPTSSGNWSTVGSARTRLASSTPTRSYRSVFGPCASQPGWNLSTAPPQAVPTTEITPRSVTLDVCRSASGWLVRSRGKLSASHRVPPAAQLASAVAVGCGGGGIAGPLLHRGGGRRLPVARVRGPQSAVPVIPRHFARAVWSGGLANVPE